MAPILGEAASDGTGRTHVLRCQPDTYMRRREEGGAGKGGGGPHRGSGWAVGLRRAEGVQARVGTQAALRVTAVAAGRGGR